MSETKQKSKDLVNCSKFVASVIMAAVINVSVLNYIWKNLQQKYWYNFGVCSKVMIEVSYVQYAHVSSFLE